MISELFIENIRADISADISSLLNFAIDDVKDFSTRSTTWSKTIVLPGTSRNNSLFGNIFETGIANDFDPTLGNVGYNFNASKSARCVIFQDNIQTFKGTVRLLEIVKDKHRIEYEIALNGELTGLNVALSSGFLNDLDFSVYDQTFNETNIISSWNNAGGSGVYYPLIDYGTYSIGKADWDIRTMRPALYVKEYIDKMFAAAGFRYKCDLFNTSRFKSLVVPHNQKKLLVSQTKVGEATITSTKVNPINIAWDAITAADFTLTSSNQHITYNGGIPFNGSIHIAVVGSFFNEDLIVTFFKNGVSIYTTTKTFSVGFTNFFTIAADIAVSLNATDYITCVVNHINDLSGNTHSISLDTVTFNSLSPQMVEIGYLDRIAINDTIPKNVRQIDFLLSIVKLFNLYVYESQFDERLILMAPYVDYYTVNSAEARDWTYKLNRDKPTRVKPLSELNSKIYQYDYHDDSDYYNDLYKKRYNQGYGSYIFDSQFEFTSQKNGLTLIFAPTVLVGYSGQDKIYSTIFKQANGIEENVDSVIRILQTKKITGVSSWNIKNGASVLTSTTDYGYAGHLDDPDNPTNDLNFGATNELFFILTTGNLSNTQFNIYWSSYMAEITDKDSKMLIASFYLTPKDIFELDFSKYIFVDGVLFRLNKITDYNVSVPSDCQVELLKVINTTYTEAIPTIGQSYLWIDSDLSYILDSDTSKMIIST